MGAFDFITDEKFRASLEVDLSEIEACANDKAWKAVHVLVGSVVEAVLVDYLLSVNWQKITGSDPLKMEFYQLISACRTEGVLSAKTEALSNVVRNYRNLIHPGRLFRLGEKVDENGATVARALLRMIVEEVAEKKRANYGYTAEQIVTKLTKDPSTIAILPHLFKETKDAEKERLLRKVIPESYFELDVHFADEWGDRAFATELRSRLSQCFRVAMETASDEIKKRVASDLVRIVKEEEEFKVFAFETAFFRAKDWKFLDPDEVELVRGHLFSYLQGKVVTAPLLASMEGIEDHLGEPQVDVWVDSFVRTLLARDNEQIKTDSRKFFEGTYWLIQSHIISDKIFARLDTWISHLEENQKNPEAAALIKSLKANCDIPF